MLTVFVSYASYLINLPGFPARGYDTNMVHWLASSGHGLFPANEYAWTIAQLADYSSSDFSGRFGAAGDATAFVAVPVEVFAVSRRKPSSTDR